MFSKKIFFAVVALLIVTNVSGKSTGRIVGGTPIPIEIAPYQASLQYTSPGQTKTKHFCGASIISEKCIVTAGHCTEELEPDDFIVLVGTAFYNSGGKKMEVERIINHQNYNTRTQDNDIALVVLSKLLEFGVSVQPIALPSENEIIPLGAMCTVSGWGDKKQFMLFRKTELRAAEVPIVDFGQCNNNYKGFGGITPRMICAGFEKGGKDACQGDSGGPLAYSRAPSGDRVVRYYSKETSILVGIVSWGNDCGAPNYPGVYTDVRMLRGWLREQTGL